MKHKKHKKNNLLKILGVILGIIVIVFVAFCVFKCANLKGPGDSVEVTIEEGSGANQVSYIMCDAGLIIDPGEMIDTINSMNATSKIKSGTYLFEGGKSVKEYVEILIKGPGESSPRVTISEGMRLTAICKEVSRASRGRISEEEFSEATKDASAYKLEYPFLSEAGSNSLEGFLPAKTFSVSTEDSAKDLVRIMLEHYQKDCGNLDYSYPRNHGLSDYEVLILASIVEKEAKPGLEKQVASVFYNRLKNHMYLNSDATTAYEVKHDPTPEEVHANTPYSTYTNYGLPPTPICSPGQNSIDAVCHPDETEYLYFYFKDGNYAFSKTYEEHQQAIERM